MAMCTILENVDHFLNEDSRTNFDFITCLHVFLLTVSSDSLKRGTTRTCGGSS